MPRARPAGCQRCSDAHEALDRPEFVQTDSGTIGLATCHDRPDDPRSLVRHRDGRDPHGFACEQIGQPWINRLGIVLGPSYQGGHADNEQLAQVFVAHFGDATEPLFAAARLLKGRQSNQAANCRPERN